MTSVSTRDRKKERQTRHRESNMKMEAEIRMMSVQAENHQESLAASITARGKEGFSPRAIRGNVVLVKLVSGFWLPEPWKYIYVVLSHQVCSNLVLGH
jgi:hypothetical protein